MVRKLLPDKLVERLPALRMPEFAREVEIPVYLIHISPDPEDYFFIIDFEDFVERSTQGLFVRPKLKIWAGRNDFARGEFARHFREVFATEFDRMRADVVAGAKGRKLGWLNWSDALMLAPNLISGLLANLVLMIATSTGKAVFGSFSLPRWLKGKSKAAKVEEEIERTRSAAEQALERIDVVLHPELHAHAWRDGGGGPRADLDRDAWPLPGHVRAHLTDGKSGSWW